MSEMYNTSIILECITLPIFMLTLFLGRGKRWNTITGFFAVIVLLIFRGIISIDMITSDTSLGGKDKENCIQGTQAMANTGYDLNAIGQLQGTMTEYEKNFSELGMKINCLEFMKPEGFKVDPEVLKKKKTVREDG